MIQVREYAQLTTDQTVLSSLDLAIIKRETVIPPINKNTYK